MRLSRFLFSGVALLSLAVATARAEVPAKKQAPASAHSRRAAAHASVAQKTKAAEVRAGSEDLEVRSARKGSHDAVEIVNRQTMDHFVAGTSPMQILALTTPGVNFASDDAFGLDTVANTLYVRGFNQSQLGASLDGIPMGEQGFHNWSGLSVDQMEIQENINSVTVSQGAGALDTPSTQTLGGAITFTSSDPSDKVGGRIGQTFGSYDAFRTFGRVDSGVLNASGTKFYAAYARTDQDLWKGYGYQLEQQANFKLVQPVGDRGKITAIFDYSNFEQYNYMGLTKNIWRQMGRNATYLKPDYALAKEYAYYAQNGGVPAGLTGILSNDEIGDYAYDSTQTQRNYLSALTGEFRLFPNVTSRTVAYGHVSNGDYGGTNPFLTSPDSGVLMANETGHPDVRRLGFVQNFDIHAAYDNDIKTGLWYENNRFQYPMEMYEDGVDSAHPSISNYKNGTTWFSDAFNTNTFQFYLQDTYRIIPGMTFTAGFRSMLQTTHGGTKADYTAETAAWGTYYSHPASGSLTASDAFLPHFNWDWNFLRHHELYIDIAENMRSYSYGQQSSSGNAWGGLGTKADPAQSVFDANRKSLKPERTWNYVIGYRYNSEFFTGSVDFYHTDYYNRLAAITSGPTGNTYGAFLNVGRETMNGADVAGTIRPVRGLAITNSFSWNDATYEDDRLPYSGGYVSIKGKHQVYYPKFMYKANLTYTWKRATFNFNATYTSSRPMTYMNDERIPACWTSNLNIAYDFGGFGFVKDFKSSFGITNLFNKNYIGGVYGAASVAGDDNANLFVAAPREFFGTIDASF